jgi:hypothetical protein
MTRREGKKRSSLDVVAAVQNHVLYWRWSVRHPKGSIWEAFAVVCGRRVGTSYSIVVDRAVVVEGWQRSPWRPSPACMTAVQLGSPVRDSKVGWPRTPAGVVAEILQPLIVGDMDTQLE